MAWTAPRTWVASEIVTAAIMNTHVRDNLNALNGYVLKTADQSVTSSAVLVNDTHLFYAIPALGTYAVDLWLLGTSATNAAGDLNFGFTFPTGTLYTFGAGLDVNLASGLSGTSLWAGGTATSGVAFQAFGLSTSVTAMQLRCLFVATATGTLRLQWSQSVSNASASTLKAGSHLLVKQVA